MALTQFNQWEPQLDPVNGVMQQEPRVFGHDAKLIVIGAINNTDSNHGLNMTSGGTGYAVDDEITVTTPTGTGAAVDDRAIVVVSEINAPAVTVLNDDLIAAATTNQTDFVDNNYTGTVGVTAGYSTSGAGTGLIITVTVSGNTATKVNVDSVGTGFVAGDTITITGSGGILGGATGNLVLTLGKGNVTDYYIKVSGVTNKNYLVGGAANHVSVSPAGGSGFASTVTNIDIPNTQKRGCCLYIGDITAGAQLKVIMEAAKHDGTAGTGYPATSTVTFESVLAGGYNPILVKQLVYNATGPTSVVALY